MLKSRNEDNKEIKKKTIKKSSKKIDRIRSIKKKRVNKWTDNEYNSLINLVRQNGEEWEAIASKIPNKTWKQCMQKFKNSQRSAKKGNWSYAEDKILLDWVDKYGPSKWTECSKLIKGRCGKQCRERWVNILNPVVKKGNWSNEEQEKIFENLSIYFTSWSSISKILPGRTENSIKNYFYSSIRRLKSNPILQIFRDIYVDYTKTLEDIDLIRDQINSEISKFNRLSQKICFFLLNRQKNEKFLDFLVSILLGNLRKKSDKTFSPKSDIMQKLDSSNVLPFAPHPSIYIPKERSMVPAHSNMNKFKIDDKKKIFDVLKKCAQQTNKKDLIYIIKFLETQLLQNSVIPFKDEKKIKINLPFCWNCATKNCNSHQKSNMS